jgi:hypothetical protein
MRIRPKEVTLAIKSQPRAREMNVIETRKTATPHHEAPALKNLGNLANRAKPLNQKIEASLTLPRTRKTPSDKAHLENPSRATKRRSRKRTRQLAHLASETGKAKPQVSWKEKRPLVTMKRVVLMGRQEPGSAAKKVSKMFR